jgi:glyoxylate utilization-related uncharacterized protein
MIILQIFISNLVASLAGSIFLILLGIIGFFLVRHFSTQDKLFESIEKLSRTISGMNATILLLTEKQDIAEKQFEDQKTRCEKHFDKIDLKVSI